LRSWRLIRRVNDEMREFIAMAEKAGKKGGSPFWLAVAKELRRPRRARAEVNLNLVSRLTSPDESIVIPGKLLGHGKIAHRVRVASVSASPSAVRKLLESGGEYVPLEEMISRNPSGKGLRLIR